MTQPSDFDELARDRAHLIHPLQNAVEQASAHVWVRGSGATLVDQSGREYLDALAGLWNVIVGHGRRELGEAAAKQMETLGYASFYSGSSNRPAIELAERLAQICYPQVNRFFFTSGGAEANEAAFKTARWYWKLAGKPDKTKIISRLWGYHGTTLATMSASGLANYWPMFEPRTPGFLHIASPYPYRFERPSSATANDARTPGQMAADLLEEAIKREGAGTIAAFIGEPVQGAGGTIIPPDDYWPRIREICDRHDVLLIADEVITGFGRTGPWFALSRWGIEPDIVTLAKGITSGYFPLGAMGVSDKLAAALDDAHDERRWMHAYTNSGHPVGCAVALANLDILEREDLLARNVEIGQQLQAGVQTLTSHPAVGDARGLGSLAAIELVADKETKAHFPPQFKAGERLHHATQARGMFTRMRGDTYNLAPCYVVEPGQIERMIQILADSLSDFACERAI